MRIEKNGVAIDSLDTWWRLAPPKDPHRHWVDGRSAKEVARAWLGGAPASPPAEITALLTSHPDFKDVAIDLVEPEARLKFDGRAGETRNADLAAIGRDNRGDFVLTVEAKADEEFGPMVSSLFGDALERLVENPRSGGVSRVIELVQSILPPRAQGTVEACNLRYQLLTAVAGTLAHADRLEVNRAVVVIQEFHTPHTSSRHLGENAVDLDRFVARLTRGQIPQVIPGTLVGPVVVPGEPLFLRRAGLYIGKTIRHVGNASAA
jgi:hypothetical protein